jgi:hypothetical protein
VSWCSRKMSTRARQEAEVQCQVDLLQRADVAVSKKRILPSGSRQANDAKQKPAQCPSCEARTREFVCRWEVADKAAQGSRSRSHEGVNAAEKGKSGDEGDESDSRTTDLD